MPLYELCLVLRPLPKAELVGCLKRTANLIWNQNGVLKKIEYLGYDKLPYQKKGIEEGEIFTEGSHFLYHISMNSTRMKEVRPELKLDLDIIRSKFMLVDEIQDSECTLEDELQPPFYRKSVQPLLENKNVRADRR